MFDFSINFVTVIDIYPYVTIIDIYPYAAGLEKLKINECEYLGTTLEIGNRNRSELIFKRWIKLVDLKGKEDAILSKMNSVSKAQEVEIFVRRGNYSERSEALS